MTNTACIRAAQASDENRFIELCMGLTRFNTQHNSENRLDDLDVAERMTRRKEKARSLFSQNSINEEMQIFVCEHSERVVGYAIVYIVDGRYGYLDEMFVEPVARGCGCGRAMLDFATAWSRERQVKQLRLNVFSWNKKAIDLYEANDFTPYFISYMKKLD